MACHRLDACFQDGADIPPGDAGAGLPEDA
jgi:hypothetical protein